MLTNFIYWAVTTGGKSIQKIGRKRSTTSTSPSKKTELRSALHRARRLLLVNCRRVVNGEDRSRSKGETSHDDCAAYGKYARRGSCVFGTNQDVLRVGLGRRRT